MKYNPPPNATDPDQGYTNGQAGKLQGSPVNAMAIEYPQREIVAVIEAAGFTPDNADLTQLLQAIQFLFPEDKPVYQIGQYVDFSHVRTVPVGFVERNGTLLQNADTAYSTLWEWLQEPAQAWLLVTEQDWQAFKAEKITLGDGSQIDKWPGGIGGANKYVLDAAARTIRVPDTRGMYAESAGYDSLVVGGTHGDMIRQIEGSTRIDVWVVDAYGVFSADHNVSTTVPTNNSTQTDTIVFNSSNVHPTGPAVKPRAYGTLGCIYVGGNE